MGWWGKLLGGGFGFLVGGPLGAIIGAVLGHNFDSGLKKIAHDDADLSPGDQERVQMAFFTATFAVMGHVAKADGQVTRDEIQMAEAIMAQMQLTAEQRKVAIDLFNQGKSDNYDINGAVDQFRIECRRRTNLMRMFVEIQLQAAYADGQLHESEAIVLREVCDQLRFPQFVFRQMEALVRASRSDERQRQSQQGDSRQTSAPAALSAAQAREVLGVDSTAGHQAVKKAYRKLMSQHHPDKLVAKGLPPEMIKLATERTQKIREAYDVLKEAGGWKS